MQSINPRTPPAPMSVCLSRTPARSSFSTLFTVSAMNLLNSSPFPTVGGVVPIAVSTAGMAASSGYYRTSADDSKERKVGATGITCSSCRTSAVVNRRRSAGDHDQRYLVAVACNSPKAPDDAVRQEMHERGKCDQRDCNGACPPAAGGRSPWQASHAMRGGIRGARTTRALQARSRGNRLTADKREKSLLQRARAFSGVPAQLVERPLGDEPARGNDADAVGHAFGDLQNVRRHDHGAAGIRAAHA